MRKFIALLLPLMLVTGCAQHYTDYAGAVRDRDIAVATASSEQQKESYAAWTAAISALGASTSPNAQAALMALALQKPQGAALPSQKIAAPASGADYISALTPAVGIVSGAWAGGKIIDALANAGGVSTTINSGGGDVSDSGQVTQTTAGGDINQGASGTSAAEATAAGTIEGDLESCKEGGATMGDAAVCMAGLGYDASITGGILHIGGEDTDYGHW